MGFTYTQEQMNVITLRNRNILVSAAAGSGKTTVLVERIISRICDEKDPVDIDRLLVLTFTDAAAGEMRERIQVAIDEQLKINPTNEHMQRQATLIHNAQISTIHSFCLFLLRNHFNDIGLDPGFRVADQGELKLLTEDVLGNLLEELLDSDKVSGFMQMTDRFSNGRDLEGLKKTVLDIYKYSLSYPFPEDWLLERKQDYAVKSVEQLEQSLWGRMLLTMIENNLKECLALTENCLKLCEESGGPYMYQTALESDKELILCAMKCNNLQEYKNFFNSMKFVTLSSKKDSSVILEQRDAVKNIRDIFKNILKKIRDNFFDYSEIRLFEQMKENSCIINSLVDTVLLFMERLQGEKQEKKLIDFSDMEHFALKILLKKENDSYVPTQAAKDYRNYFEEIMIDEYQDSNLVQEWLLKSVSGEDDGHFNRFMVGDVKQSIYKFRLACPRLFMEKFDSYDKIEGIRQRIDLSKNYRSRKEVIDSVNDVFSKLMAKDLGGVNYDNESALYLGADYSDNGSNHKTELLLTLKDCESRKSNQEQEAETLAHRIKELVGNFDVFDKEIKEYRKARYSDIVILLRTKSGWNDVFKQILEKEGIPSYITTKTGYFSTNEISIIMNFLRVLDNPRQDIPLFGTLISSFGGFTEDDIAMLRLLSKKNLIDNVRLCAARECDNYSEERNLIFPVEKCRGFLKFMERYRDMVSYEPIHAILRAFLTETGYLYEVSASPAGEQKRANVLMLLKKAEDYERTSYKGLFHFIHYMEQLQKYEVDFGEAVTLDDKSDVVRIMSIHKSKGLEFPICIVAGLSKEFNQKDTQNTVIFDTEYGIGMDYVNFEKRVKIKDLRKKILAEKMKQDNLAEEIRVLYVAMTRAKEKLILSGLVSDFEKLDAKLDSHQLIMEGKTDKTIPLSMRLKSSSYLEWILDALVCENKNIDIRHIMPEDKTAGQIEEVFSSEGKKERLLTNLNTRGVSDTQKIVSFSYAHTYLKELYTKTTVSELKMVAIHSTVLSDNREEQAVSLFPENEKQEMIPRFAGINKKVSGTARGSAYHRIMELHDFTKTVGAADLNNQIKQQILEGRITREESDMVELRKIEYFLSTELAKRMGQAQQKNALYLEQPFVLGVSANRLSKDFPASETVLIQGIIDVYFIEDNEIVLMDYKTDTVKEAGELVNRYRTQLLYYTEALERITGLKVKEKLIYSFALQQVIIVQ